MIQNFLDYLINDLNLFDIVFLLIMVYSVIQCFIKGFSLSFISFLKWVLSIVITIILVPKLQPWVAEYIKSEFINNFGIGIFVFISSLFGITRDDIIPACLATMYCFSPRFSCDPHAPHVGTTGNELVCF